MGNGVSQVSKSFFLHWMGAALLLGLLGTLLWNGLTIWTWLLNLSPAKEILTLECSDGRHEIIFLEEEEAFINRQPYGVYIDSRRVDIVELSRPEFTARYRDTFLATFLPFVSQDDAVSFTDRSWLNNGGSEVEVFVIPPDDFSRGDFEALKSCVSEPQNRELLSTSRNIPSYGGLYRASRSPGAPAVGAEPFICENDLEVYLEPHGHVSYFFEGGVNDNEIIGKVNLDGTTRGMTLSEIKELDPGLQGNRDLDFFPDNLLSLAAIDACISENNCSDFHARYGATANPAQSREFILSLNSFKGLDTGQIPQNFDSCVSAEGKRIADFVVE